MIRSCGSSQSPTASSLSPRTETWQLGILRGAPPKIIWLRMGNCRTEIIERTLRTNMEAIEDLVQDPEKVVLELFE